MARSVGKTIEQGDLLPTKSARAVRAAVSQTAETFNILEGLDGVRTTIGQYLGTLGPDMAFRMVKEIVDNCYDEALAGRNDYIEICMDLDNNVYVIADKAGGIPIEMKTLEDKSKLSVLTAVFTRIHAGGKFNDSAYKVSAGTHGTGAACVQAASDSLQVWTSRSNKVWTQSFSKGRVVGSATPIQARNYGDAKPYLKESKYGTVVMFTPDQTVISEDAMRDKSKQKKVLRVAQPDINRVAMWLKTMADLNPKLKIVLTVIRGKKAKTKTYLNPNGLDAYVKSKIEDYDLGTFGKPLIFKTDYITLAAQWTEYESDDRFETFVNNSPTSDGGTHVKGMLDALADAIKPYETASDRKQSKTTTRKVAVAQYKREDLLTGLVGAFDWRMHGAAYSSQIKDKLVSNVTKEVYDVMLPVFTEYFTANKSVPKTLLTRARELNKGREALAKTVKALAETKKSGRGAILPGILAASQTKNPLERELFSVEGDSASGTAKDARDPHYQEVFKCKGKPVNAMTQSLDRVLNNETIQGFIISAGLDLKSLDVKATHPKFDCKDLRVGKILLMSDADDDGYHINVLILSFIAKYAPALIDMGIVYIVDAPLYNLIHGGKHYGGMTREEVLAKIPKGARASAIQRAKGWGEVSPDLMEIIGFNPETRKLIQVKPFENKEHERWFIGITSDDRVAKRKMLGIEEQS
jgi:DNA gyrase subunit B